MMFPLLKSFPINIDTRMLAKAAVKKLIDGRLERKSVTDHAGEYMAMFRELQVGVDRMELSRNELNKRRDQQSESHRRYVMRVTYWACGILLSIAAIVLALLET